MKKIGILLRETNEFKKIDNDFISYLKNYDVCLIGIIYDETMDFNKIIEVIDLCDGIIMPGGNEEFLKNISIAKYLHTINKPTLGICLGMQNMAESSNGIIEKLDTNFHNSNDEYVHRVSIKKGTYLNQIIGSNSILVNSRHNYHVVKTNLSVSAYSKDYVIEAVEDKSKRFYIGVQWHPESIYNDINSRLLIEEFLKKC